MASSRSPQSEAADRRGIVRVDPHRNRPANADEMSPESLIPDVVRADLDTTRHGTEPQDRESRIAARALDFARERGFAPGAELDDWLRAEKEIDAEINAQKSVKQTQPEDQFTG